MADNANQNLTLSITDIADAVKIIDYACEQGAFKGWVNIRQIMIIRDRLEMFVAAASVEAAGNKPAENPTPEVNTSAPVLNEADKPVRKPRKR